MYYPNLTNSNLKSTSPVMTKWSSVGYREKIVVSLHLWSAMWRRAASWTFHPRCPTLHFEQAPPHTTFGLRSTWMTISSSTCFQPRFPTVYTLTKLRILQCLRRTRNNIISSSARCRDDSVKIGSIAREDRCFSSIVDWNVATLEAASWTQARCQTLAFQQPPSHFGFDELDSTFLPFPVLVGRKCQLLSRLRIDYESC